MYANPMTEDCPKCAAEVGDPCVRLSGPYGQGNPLRRMHKERHEAARARLARELAENRARYLRLAHAQGGPAPD